MQSELWLLRRHTLTFAQLLFNMNSYDGWWDVGKIDCWLLVAPQPNKLRHYFRRCMHAHLIYNFQHSFTVRTLLALVLSQIARIDAENLCIFIYIHMYACTSIYMCTKIWWRWQRRTARHRLLFVVVAVELFTVFCLHICFRFIYIFFLYSITVFTTFSRLLERSFFVYYVWLCENFNLYQRFKRFWWFI